MSLNGRSDLGPKHFLLVTLGVTLLATLWLQLGRIADPYVVEEDFRNLYWMHLFRDPDLFSEDALLWPHTVKVPLNNTTLIVDAGSPGYSLLFQLADQVVSFVLFSKLLIFPLTLLAVYYLFRIVDHLHGPAVAFCVSMFFLVLNFASATSVSTTGGLHRSFIFPLLLAMVYYLMIGRDRSAALVIVLSALLYPPAFVMNCLLYGLTLLSPGSESRWPVTIAWSRLRPLMVAVFLGLLILSPVFLLQMRRAGLATDVPIAQDLSGSLPSSTPTHMLLDPFYKKGNLGAIFDFFPLVGRAGLAPPGIGVFQIVMLFVLAVPTWILNRSVIVTLDPVLKRFFLASWIGFTLAWLGIIFTSSLLLYFPSRYTDAPLFLFLLIFVGLNADKTLRRAASFLVTVRAHLLWLLLPALLLVFIVAVTLPAPQQAGRFEPGDLRGVLIMLGLAILLLAVIIMRRKRREPAKQVVGPMKWNPWSQLLFAAFGVLISAVYVSVLQPRFFKASQPERELYKYLETLPADVRLAGSPQLASAIPLFAARQVLFSCKRSGSDFDLVLAGLDAYYAPAGGEERIVNFCRDYDVDYLVVDQAGYTPENLEKAYCRFGPYDTDFRQTLPERAPFALAEVPDELTVFRSDSVIVVPCDERLLDDGR
jgi:hypothetical protein